MKSSLHEQARDSKIVGKICEQVIIEIYSRILTANSIALDGGANVGWHTFGMAKMATSGHIYAIEPLPVLCAILRRRAKKYDSVVTAIEAALSDYDGRAQFTYFDGPNNNHPDHPHWNAGVSALIAPARHLSMSHQMIQVTVTTIDSLFSKLPSRLDFIKLDIEGGEFHAIKGGIRTISRLRPFIAFEDGGPGIGQLYGYAPSDFTAMIAAAGYELCDAFGARYSLENWLARDRWRPFYTLAIPQEWDRWPLIQDAVAAAARGLGLTAS